MPCRLISGGSGPPGPPPATSLLMIKPDLLFRNTFLKKHWLTVWQKYLSINYNEYDAAPD